MTQENTIRGRLLSSPEASTTQEGIMRFATEQEVLEGTLNNVAVTPQTLEAKLATFIFEQGTASDVWEIEHNLNKYPSVTVVDTTGRQFIPAVKYVDENNIIISMNGSFKGKALLT